MFQTDASFRCGNERCYHSLQSSVSCRHLGDIAPIGHSNDTFDEWRVSGALVGVSRWPVKLTGKLIGFTAGNVPVAEYPRSLNHEVPLVMSPVMQAACSHLDYGSTWCSTSRILGNCTVCVFSRDRCTDRSQDLFHMKGRCSSRMKRKSSFHEPFFRVRSCCRMSAEP